MDKLFSLVEQAAGQFFEDPNDGGEGGEELIVGEDLADVPFPTGKGHQLSFMHYRDPEMHSKPYFFTTQLGSAFPSYHCNPQKHKPARWTQIEGVKPPCESLLAPRIRLAPQELSQKISTLRNLVGAGLAESDPPRPISLNLSHQALGDPYQYYGLRAFLSVNQQVEVLNLNDNELEDISDLRLHNVRVLHLSHNNFVTFQGLPALPSCEVLYLSDNFLSGFTALTSGKLPRLKHITVDLNPIMHRADLFEKLQSCIPTLETVDRVNPTQREELKKIRERMQEEDRARLVALHAEGGTAWEGEEEDEGYGLMEGDGETKE